MFGLFQARCPVGLVEKTWIEWRLRWLAGTLGIERLLGAEVLLPTDDYFPGEFLGTRADARELMVFLGQYMGVNTGSIDLEVVPDELMPAAQELAKTLAAKSREALASSKRDINAVFFGQRMF